MALDLKSLEQMSEHHKNRTSLRMITIDCTRNGIGAKIIRTKFRAPLNKTSMKITIDSRRNEIRAKVMRPNIRAP
jgi:hypothetical protein